MRENILPVVDTSYSGSRRGLMEVELRIASLERKMNEMENEAQRRNLEELGRMAARQNMIVGILWGVTAGLAVFFVCLVVMEAKGLP